MAKTRTRSFAARSRRWSRKASKAVTTLPLPLSGVHPTQLNRMGGGVLDWFAAPAHPFSLDLDPYLIDPSIIRPSLTTVFSRNKPLLMASGALPSSSSSFSSVDPCSRRQARRRVLFALGHSGGGHAPTPARNKWKESC